MRLPETLFLFLIANVANVAAAQTVSRARVGVRSEPVAAHARAESAGIAAALGDSLPRPREGDEQDDEYRVCKVAHTLIGAAVGALAGGAITALLTIDDGSDRGKRTRKIGIIVGAIAGGVPGAIDAYPDRDGIIHPCADDARARKR